MRRQFVFDLDEFLYQIVVSKKARDAFESAPPPATSPLAGAGKSLVVDDPRYVYHDVEGDRWFGA